VAATEDRCEHGEGGDRGINGPGQSNDSETPGRRGISKEELATLLKQHKKLIVAVKRHQDERLDRFRLLSVDQPCLYACIGMDVSVSCFERPAEEFTPESTIERMYKHDGETLEISLVSTTEQQLYNVMPEIKKGKRRYLLFGPRKNVPAHERVLNGRELLDFKRMAMRAARDL
jgi:hypothetical protein